MHYLIFPLPYWGHLSVCMGIADSLIHNGDNVTFGFVYPPDFWIHKEITERGHNCYWSLEYVRSAIEHPSWDTQFREVLRAEADIISRFCPDIIINDLRYTIPISGRKSNIPVASIIRCLGSTTLKKNKRVGFLRSNLKLNSISWNELLWGDIQLIPHAKAFLNINTPNPIYYKFCWSDQRVRTPADIEKKPIVCVLSTANPHPDILDLSIGALNNFKSDTIICYPHTYSDSCTDVSIIEWGNLNYLFSNARVVISVGGHGTIMRALMQGLPCIVLDSGEHPVPYYGLAVESHGAGIFIQRTSLSPDSLSRAIESILNNDIFRKKSGRLQSILQSQPDIVEAIQSVGNQHESSRSKFNFKPRVL